MATKIRSNLWVFIRLGIILGGFIQARFFIADLEGDFSRPSWSFFFEMMAIMAFAMLFIVWIQTLSPFEDGGWSKPNWFRNPFSYKQPLLFFDVMAYYMLSIGAGCALIGFLGTPKSWAWQLPISIGSGLWLGVRLCVIAFPARIEPAQQA